MQCDPVAPRDAGAFAMLEGAFVLVGTLGCGAVLFARSTAYMAYARTIHVSVPDRIVHPRQVQYSLSFMLAFVQSTQTEWLSLDITFVFRLK